MTDPEIDQGLDESTYTTDTPLAVLAGRVMALARRTNGYYGIVCASFGDRRGALEVTVLDERARRKVLEVAPEAEVRVL